MKYWLLKSEPNTYSWDDLTTLGKDHWDGVRNYQARNNIRSMEPGDLGFFYHSVKDKEIVGICKVVSEPYPDPTAEDKDRWSVVDLVPVAKLERTITLDDIKKEETLSNMVLVNNTRLSVQPVTEQEFFFILELVDFDTKLLQ